MFQLFVKDTSNSDLYEVPFLKCDFTDELNVGKNARFSFDFQSTETVAQTYGVDSSFIFSGGFREIYLEKDGAKVYYGVVSDYSLSKDDKGALKIEVASVGFFSLFAKRRTGASRIFIGIDAGTIAWTLIDESQLSDTYGSFGITQGVSKTSVNRDRTYKFSNIKDEIVQMSNNNLDNGFDFDIDNEKKFNVYYPTKGSNREDIFLDKQNIISWSLRKPLILSLTNRVYVMGEGYNNDLLYESCNSSSEYRQAFTLLEDTISHRTASESTTLTDRGNKYLLKNQSPIVQITITHTDGEPDMENYDIGDYIRVSLEEIGIINEYRRVLKRTVQIDGNGLALVTVALE